MTRLVDCLGVAALVTAAVACASSNTNRVSPTNIVPDQPPDSIPQVVWDEVHAPANLVTNDPRLTGTFPRNLVVVMFHPATPQRERQAAVDSIKGEVVGGVRLTPGGLYYVRIHDDGTAEPLFGAIDRLQRLPQVDFAMPEPPQLGPSGAKGADRSRPQVREHERTGPSVPVEAPDSVPEWVYADSNFTGPSAYIPVKFRKNILGVRFRREATQAQRQAAIDLVSGTVVGGLNGGIGNGLYLVRVADSGDGSVLMRASKQLQALPYVLAATPDVAVGLQ